MNWAEHGVDIVQSDELRSEVVPVRTARGSPGAAKGREFWKSGHECTGLGDVGKGCASVEGSARTGATQFSHTNPGRRSPDLKDCHLFVE
jgi:hypothetical protein